MIAPLISSNSSSSDRPIPPLISMQLLFIVELALILNIAEILFAGRSAITNVLIVSLMWVGLIQLDHHSVMYLATS